MFFSRKFGIVRTLTVRTVNGVSGNVYKIFSRHLRSIFIILALASCCRRARRLINQLSYVLLNYRDVNTIFLSFVPYLHCMICHHCNLM